MFRGVYTALITPFKNGKLDEKAFQSFIEWQVAQGVHGLVPCGTTGESPTLSHEEHNRLVELCVEAAKGKVKVLAGSGSNSTEEALRLSRHAQKAGADGLLVVAPYYNKPTQEGIYRHYETIAKAVDLPIIIYNIPGRSVINITDETLARLASIPNIVGVKDATGDLARVSTIRARVGEDFLQLSGEDMTALGYNALGGVGVISVTSNIAPKRCAELQNLTLMGNYTAALAVQDKLIELHDVMFCETSPGPVKYALSLMGKCSCQLRLPLVEPSEVSKVRIRKAVEAAGLI